MQLHFSFFFPLKHETRHMALIGLMARCSNTSLGNIKYKFRETYGEKLDAFIDR